LRNKFEVCTFAFFKEIKPWNIHMIWLCNFSVLRFKYMEDSLAQPAPTWEDLQARYWILDILLVPYRHARYISFISVCDSIHTESKHNS
jgi:hypothetical protein